MPRDVFRPGLGDPAEAETPKVDAFMDAVCELCRAHGFALGHEDVHGAFVVLPYGDDSDLAWLRAALVSPGALQGETK